MIFIDKNYLNLIIVLLHMAFIPCFCCRYNTSQKYTFLANPDDLLTNDIRTMYVNDDKYHILEKKAHIVKKCRKYYNVWNYQIIRNLTNNPYLLVTSSQEKNRWYIMLYSENFLGVLPKNIDNKKEVFKIDYSITLENIKTDFFDIPLDD